MMSRRAEYTRPKNWGYWKFYVDVLNAYDRQNITGYEYAPNGKNADFAAAGLWRACSRDENGERQLFSVDRV
jgi:hypothetical protein